jgi:hypothetical protein
VLRFLPLLALVLAGCAAKKVDNQFDEKSANSRAIEQARMRYVEEGRVESERGAEIAVYDPSRTFNLATANFSRTSSYGQKTTQTTPFNFTNRARTKGFLTGNYNAKTAYLGEAKFATKSATLAKQSWITKMFTRTKSYDTPAAHDANKSLAIRGVPDGERPFLNQGRRQADLDKNGQKLLPYGNYGGMDLGQSWSGELKEMTITDVKNLLNKN